MFLLPLIALCVIAGGWYLFHGRTHHYQTASVTRGPITQEVLASGNTEASTTANMHFTQSGTLAALPVVVGQRVHKGEVLARLDDTTATANYNVAAAKLAGAQAALDKLLAGSSAANVAVYQSAQASAQVASTNAAANLTTLIAGVHTSLDNVLGSQIDQLFSQPQTANPGFGVTITSGTTKYFITTTAAKQTTIASLRTQVKADIAALAQSIAAKDALVIQSQKARDALGDMAALLADIADVINNYVPTDTTGKTVYQAYQSSIAAARTQVATNQQTLIADLAAYQSATAGVQQADSNLSQVQAPARSEDVAAAEAAVKAAQANVDVAAAALADTRLVAPADGTITNTTGVVGEVVDPSTAVVALLPTSIIDVKAHVSEDNIIGVKIGDPVRIELDAFPAGTSFQGVVTKIDPAETIIGGAVYYLTTIAFASSSPLIRPGMTTNVWIQTGHADHTLLVPVSALTKTSTSTSVSVLNGTRVVHQSVTTGLADQNGRVEITSGLTAGQQVILGQ